MNDENIIQLFILKCAVIETDLRKFRASNSLPQKETLKNFLGESLEKYILQFELENRDRATKMSLYYQLFYMLENDIRKLIVETLQSSYGENWWELKVPQRVKEEAAKNIDREDTLGISLRSESEIDYTTFGQLSDIIKDNYSDFAGILRSLPSVNRVLASLNTLRGTIAHCGILAEDEVDRLKLSFKDWFRVLEGPRAQ